MSLENKEYKRLSPTESVALVFDDTSNKKFWRYRYKLKDGGGLLHEMKDFPFEAFKSILSFKEHIESLDKPKGYFI